MSRSIDTRRPVTFYDDRNQAGVDLCLTRVLFEDAEHVLGHAQAMTFSRQGQLTLDPEVSVVLFRKDNRLVLTSELDSWYAENPDETQAPVATRNEGV